QSGQTALTCVSGCTDDGLSEAECRCRAQCLQRELDFEVTEELIRTGAFGLGAGNLSRTNAPTASAACVLASKYATRLKRAISRTQLRDIRIYLPQPTRLRSFRSAEIISISRQDWSARINFSTDWFR